MEFSTGCEGTQRMTSMIRDRQGHGLDTIAILIKTRRSTMRPGKYRGLDRYEAREAIIADLDACGALQKIEDHKMHQKYRSAR